MYLDTGNVSGRQLDGYLHRYLGRVELLLLL